MERQTRWVNLIDRNVDVHVVRIVVDHAYALVFDRRLKRHRQAEPAQVTR
jgi:hypothetical protein